jgi:hypothetical protein
MSFVIATGPCCACGNVFSFNPERVPSFQGKPICAPCIQAVNVARQKKGLRPFEVLPGAYSAEVVEETT